MVTDKISSMISAGGRRPIKHSLQLAFAISLLVHSLALFVPQRTPPVEPKGVAMQARLIPPAKVSETLSRPEEVVSKKMPLSKPVLAMNKSNNKAAQRTVPAQWSAAEKQEMNEFLDDLGLAAKRAPTLAQRSLAMAREDARRQAQRGEAEMEVVERIPNSPPIDAFGLEMYMNGLLKKLNRSAAFVRNDPRAQGLRVATVQVRLNPNGTLKSFRVLNAADQQDEIAFIRRVVEQAVPFSAFPADIQRSAQSLSLIICIQPAGAGGGGFGFSRIPDGRSC